MFFSEHRLKMTSLRIGKHRIVKNIASLRKVNIAHPYLLGPQWSSEGPRGADLVPTAADWPAWAGFMVTTHFDLVSGPFWA